MLGNRSRGEVTIEPLAVDYSFFQRRNKAFTVEEVWDEENPNSELVYKRVASKLKSIAGCIELAFSRHELETIQLLLRIEKSLVPVKTTVQRTPPSSRSLKVLRRLEFGVNYDRSSSTYSGSEVLNG